MLHVWVDGAGGWVVALLEVVCAVVLLDVVGVEGWVAVLLEVVGVEVWVVVLLGVDCAGGWGRGPHYALLRAMSHNQFNC